MKRTKEEAAEVAASWWSEKIARPKFDAGADNPGLAMAEIIATVNAATIEESNQCNFKDILKEKILNRLGKVNQVYLGSDYAPEGILALAMDEANIPLGNCPWKTSMWIEIDGTVSVSYGYGRPVVEL